MLKNTNFEIIYCFSRSRFRRSESTPTRFQPKSRLSPTPAAPTPDSVPSLNLTHHDANVSSFSILLESIIPSKHKATESVLICPRIHRTSNTFHIFYFSTSEAELKFSAFFRPQNILKYTRKGNQSDLSK